jgi:hypothetical protein
VQGRRRVRRARPRGGRASDALLPLPRRARPPERGDGRGPQAAPSGREVIAAADAADVAMLFTGRGTSAIESRPPPAAGPRGPRRGLILSSVRRIFAASVVHGELRRATPVRRFAAAAPRPGA